MPCLALKLSMAVPSYAHKRVWVRTITPTTTITNPLTTTTTIAASSSSSSSSLLRRESVFKLFSSSSSSSLSLYRDRDKHRDSERVVLTAAIYRNQWRISPSYPCAPSAHDSKSSPQSLGFSFHHKCFSLFPSSSSSSISSGSTSEDDIKQGFSGSSSFESGSEVLYSEMGSEDKDHHRQDWSAGESNGKQSQQQQQRLSNKFLTLPTILTLGRVAAVPLLISTFYVDSWWGTTATTSIFIAAAITDWLDGYIARKMRLGSAFGAFLDPVADKLMVAATLVLLCTRPLDIGIFGQVPWLLTVPAIAIIGREITMSAVREWAASQNTKLLEAVAVNNLGKWKTATQMTALTILLALRDSSLGGPGIFVATGVALLYISAGLAVWSLVVYMSKIWRVLLK
ncbi:CDP-diacylglycerol--glycerol-3-phosphate 3-phosphatidyltransferase 1, chloroplastic-like [Humulus lupulus]|uniref:CDP-diacylglycerol--glycerol-3-phosphate 3-phosphatidyltransferase 1, chloroplastic-like n=1 Tax=Humulus lupulus TaxID=3486 RepID=UPI002B416473|nr:CDP-diacylglycerol--glycerol-3-phosphate 3-phosphatidyltransferase 1, chloroplastic-like [Humulus lupulus]